MFFSLLLLKYTSFRKFQNRALYTYAVFIAVTAAVAATAEQCERGCVCIQYWCSFYSSLALSCGEFTTQQIVRVIFHIKIVSLKMYLCVCTHTFYVVTGGPSKSLLPSIHPSIVLYCMCENSVVFRLKFIDLAMCWNWENDMYICARIVLGPANILLIMNYKETCELTFEAETYQPLRESLFALCSFTHIRFIPLILCMDVCVCACVWFYFCSTWTGLLLNLAVGNARIKYCTHVVYVLVRVIWGFLCANVSVRYA